MSSHNVPFSEELTALELCCSKLDGTPGRERVEVGAPPHAGAVFFQHILSRRDGLLGTKKLRLGYNATSSTITAIMPTRIHDVVQSWIQDTFYDMERAAWITRDENRYLAKTAGTTYKNFIGDYVGFGKEPGMAVRPRSYDMPTLVVESGWSESRTQLREDCRMWIAGSPATQIAILVNWNVCTAGRLAGIVEVWALDTNGQPMVSSTHTIFPQSASTSDTFEILRRQIWGHDLGLERDPDDTWSFDVDILRSYAITECHSLGLTPAT